MTTVDLKSIMLSEINQRERQMQYDHMCGIKKTALADTAQWIECQPEYQKVTGSIPSQGPCLGCGPGPQ